MEHEQCVPGFDLGPWNDRGQSDACLPELVASDREELTGPFPSRVLEVERGDCGRRYDQGGRDERRTCDASSHCPRPPPRHGPRSGIFAPGPGSAGPPSPAKCRRVFREKGGKRALCRRVSDKVLPKCSLDRIKVTTRLVR